MERLLRNLEINALIQSILTVAIANLPKVYAYADDVNCTINDSIECLQEVFKEYKRLSTRSCLVLNAAKTKIMRLGTNKDRGYNITYLNQQYPIETKAQIKINVIFF